MTQSEVRPNFVPVKNYINFGYFYFRMTDLVDIISSCASLPLNEQISSLETQAG